jgi:hypothetical protein
MTSMIYISAGAAPYENPSTGPAAIRYMAGTTFVERDDRTGRRELPRSNRTALRYPRHASLLCGPANFAAGALP